MVLTARRADKLAEVKEKCLAAHKDCPGEQKGREVITIEADVTSKGDVEGLLGRIGNKRIDM